MERVGRAAAGAVQPGPAVPAFLPGIDVAGPEFFPKGGVGDALPYIAHAVLFLTYELVAGVKVPPGGDRHVFGAAPAA